MSSLSLFSLHDSFVECNPIWYRSTSHCDRTNFVQNEAKSNRIRNKCVWVARICWSSFTLRMCISMSVPVHTIYSMTPMILFDEHSLKYYVHRIAVAAFRVCEFVFFLIFIFINTSNVPPFLPALPKKVIRYMLTKPCTNRSVWKKIMIEPRIVTEKMEKNYIFI